MLKAQSVSAKTINVQLTQLAFPAFSYTHFASLYFSTFNHLTFNTIFYFKHKHTIKLSTYICTSHLSVPSVHVQGPTNAGRWENSKR